MLVGGMPQAVEAYIQTNNFRMVDEVKRDILNLYEADFAKIDPTGRVSMLFDAIPAQLNKNMLRFKMFLSDTGLFVTLMFKDRDFTENEIYEKLLNDKLSINLGYLYENVVAQCLAAQGNELYYHTIMNEKSKHNYKIDFILARKNKIVPLEIKSSGYKAHRSLDVFTEKFSDRILQRYLVYTKDMKKEQDIICVPIYMVPFL